MRGCNPCGTGQIQRKDGCDMRRLLTKSILPIALFLLLASVGQYIYVVDGQIDWFRAMLVFGLPYGIPYMIFVIPIGGSVSGKAALLVFNAIIGALFGCFIAAWILVRAIAYLIVDTVRFVANR